MHANTFKLYITGPVLASAVCIDYDNNSRKNCPIRCCIVKVWSVHGEPGAVARLDARPPGMRTVAGSILTSGKTFFR